MGYYQGEGARLVATIPSVSGQIQPACVTDSTTKLYDCGNWTTSASWTVPSGAVSGIYVADLVRSDTGGASQVIFIVRNDASHSDLVFVTSDETWQAYNPYGGHSLYGNTTFNLTDRAYKVSYNRPFNTATLETATWIYNAEYPMVRWLEGLVVSRARRVLVGTETQQLRGGARRGCESRLLQRQREFLEDTMGNEHRRVEHGLPHAGLLQGDTRPELDSDRDCRGGSPRPTDVDGDVARSDQEPAGRWWPPGERDDRDDLQGKRAGRGQQ
jgi:hypothetical protein